MILKLIICDGNKTKEIYYEGITKLKKQYISLAEALDTPISIEIPTEYYYDSNNNNYSNRTTLELYLYSSKNELYRICYVDISNLANKIYLLSDIGKTIERLN
jgi:hypothetical protein